MLVEGKQLRANREEKRVDVPVTSHGHSLAIQGGCCSISSKQAEDARLPVLVQGREREREREKEGERGKERERIVRKIVTVGRITFVFLFPPRYA